MTSWKILMFHRKYSFKWWVLQPVMLVFQGGTPLKINMKPKKIWCCCCFVEIREFKFCLGKRCKRDVYTAWIQAFSLCFFYSEIDLKKKYIHHRTFILWTKKILEFFSNEIPHIHCGASISQLIGMILHDFAHEMYRQYLPKQHPYPNK